MRENILNAQLRAVSGKGGARQSRARGMIPGVYYGRLETNIHFAVPELELGRLLKNRPTILTLNIGDDEPRQCVIRSIQRDPVDAKFVHIDLLAVHSGELITISVSVRLNGIPTGVKDGGGVLEHGLVELSVECDPMNIPERIEVDVSHLQLGHSIHIKDLAIPNVRILEDENAIVAHVATPKIERVTATEATLPGEGAATAETEA